MFCRNRVRHFAFCTVSAILGLSMFGCVASDMENMASGLLLNSSNLTSSQAGSVAKKVVEPPEAFKIKTEYKGYAKEFQPVKELIYSGHLSEAIQVYDSNYDVAKDKKKEKVAAATSEKSAKSSKSSGKKNSGIDLKSKNLRILNNMELGTMCLDENKTKDSLDYLNKSLDELDMEESKGIITSAGKSFFSSSLEFISNNAELHPYAPVGYEKVMLLNYKTISYLLDGQQKAFNVARRAIDWQNMERKAFEKELKEVDKKFEDEEANAKKKSSKKSGSADFAGLSQLFGKTKTLLANEYSETHEKASKVASAYVNPFGDYMIGAVMEFNAQKDASKIDDAKRAYEKAYALNKSSRMLKQAADSMGKALKSGRVKDGGNLVHIVVSDGFSPEVKVMSTVVPINGSLVTIQLPKRVPVESKVSTIKVLNAKNKPLATLDVISNMEAISLRHQKQSEPGMYFQAFKMIGRSYLTQEAAGSMLGGFGKLLSSKLDSMGHPDTRSWTSLPATIRAARIRVPKGVKTLKLASYDKKGKCLAVKKLTINPDGHNFVYGRSIDNHLTAQASKNLWVN